MNRKYPLAALALTAVAWPATASAAGAPWTTTNPGGITWTAPHGCSLVLDLTTSDGYPKRIDATQAYELVVAYRNGVEIGRTVDLEDRVAQASRSARITTPVTAGDVVAVRHSSVAGMNDGTPNSVNVSASFDCPPPATTTTTIPPTTVAETVPPTTTVAVDIPPTLPATTVPAPAGRVPVPSVPPVVEPPRVATTTIVPPVALPSTGPDDDTRLIAHIAAITLGVGALMRLRWGVRRG